MSDNDDPENVARRKFMTMAGRAGAVWAGMQLMPGSIRRALAVPPARVTGTSADVEHVVILMQENRSFDHYFGTMSGVRGFGDRHPVPLANGEPVWHESDGAQVILPGCTAGPPTRSGCRRPVSAGACTRTRPTTGAVCWRRGSRSRSTRTRSPGTRSMKAR